MSVFNSLGSNYKIKHLAHMLSGFDTNKKNDFIDYLGERYNANVQPTYKGREALFLALTNSSLEPGDHVAINGYTCYAVYDAVQAAELVPVYVDIAKDSLNYSAKELEKVLKKDKEVKAVIVQNTLGFPSDMKAIEKLAKKHKLHLVEDLAHSIGMQYVDGREAGTVADAALSFSQDKVVDAVSGGAYIYGGDAQEFKTRRLKYGRFLKDYYYIFNTMFIRSGYILGGGKIYGYVLKKLKLMPQPMDGAAKNVRRPDTWHMTLAYKQFRDLEKTLAHRRRIADIYLQNLPKRVKFSDVDEATYLRFPLQVPDPKGLIAHLKRSGIYVSDTWYESPISPARSLKATNYESGMCPMSEQVASQMVNLPTHVNVDEDEANRITEKVNEWLSNQEQ